MTGPARHADLREAVVAVLGSPGTASKRWAWSQYDHMIFLGTVQGPGSDAAVIRLPDRDEAVAITTDGNSRYCYLDPYEGARLAVAEAARNVACTGARPAAVTNCLNFGNPEKPDVMWQFVEAVRGIGDACRSLGTPVTGGNVSFYNETNGRAIYPTPVIGMLGILDDASRAIPKGFAWAGDDIVLLGATDPGDFGGSEYSKVVHSVVGGKPPRLDIEREAALIETLLSSAALLSSAHDPADGGLAVALLESALAGDIGASVDLDPALEAHRLLFSESPSRAVVSCSPVDSDRLIEGARARGIEAVVIGTTGGDRDRVRFGEALSRGGSVRSRRRVRSSYVGYDALMGGEARDACGVVGIYAPGEDVSRLTYYALYALQHRGQESAGIAISDGEALVVYKDLGLVSQVFDETVLKSLRGSLAIGHVRYSTTGSSSWENAQPTYKTGPSGEIALAHNGNLVNSVDLKRMLDEAGGDPSPRSQHRSTSDTDLVAASIARVAEADMSAAILRVLPKLSGAYSFTMTDGQKVFGARDPQGFRPLAIGRLGDRGWVLASETCALDLIGATFVRDVEPGEFVTIDESGLSSQRFAEAKNARCVFEHVYFARPDSTLMGQNVYATRYRMGQRLAEESPSGAELVMPVPDSGVPAAQGFALQSGIPYGEGFVKNRYVGRTFIQPTQAMRQQGIRMKLNPLREVIEGRKVLVVDDSIVRGNTTRQIVAMLRDSGAREVHMRISSPPIKWPCFYGIDMPDQDDLIGAQMSVEEIQGHIGADSLAYLSLEGMLNATGIPADEFCTACFSSEYPVEVPEHELRGKHVFEPGALERRQGQD